MMISDFEEIYEGLKPPFNESNRASVICKAGLKILFGLGIEANSIPGIAAEAGVYRGGSLYILAHAFDGEIHAFDSWCGFPEPHPEDKGCTSAGAWGANFDDVKELLSFTDKVRFYKGFFDETFPSVPDDTIYSYVMIDADLYESYRQCINFFFPKLSPGGIMVLHDYKAWSTPGATVAVDEWFLTKPDVSTEMTSGGFIVRKN